MEGTADDVVLQVGISLTSRSDGVRLIADDDRVQCRIAIANAAGVELRDLLA